MEEKELTKSNKIKIIVLTALVFLVAIAGISYAYFTIQITGNDTASSMRLTTANMSLVYKDIEIRSGENVTPPWSSTPKTITVYNNGNTTAYYNIIWRDLYNEIINNELVISGTCTSDVQGNTCSNISETVIPTATTLSHNIAIKRGIEIEPGETHTYTVTVTFIDTGSNQNYNQNKEFYGTINIGEGSAPATLSLQTDTGTSGLSAGDTVRATQTGIDNQDFYVLSTDASQTVLLAKYNLLVGDILDYDSTNDESSLNKTLASSDAGYGLQNSTAKGYISGSIVQFIGVVPFSGTNYWDDSVCQYTGTSWGCTGTEGLKSEYANSGNPVGKTGTYVSPYPYVYNSSMSNIAPLLDYTEGYGLAQNNGYTIAYYVEEYINRLGINGTGRLLTYEEEQSLASSNNGIVFNGTSYWLGSAYHRRYVWNVTSDGSVGRINFAYGSNFGVRPVIVVNTSDIVTGELINVQPGNINIRPGAEIGIQPGDLQG